MSLKKGYRVDAIYLFGSYARGDHLKSSDMDVEILPLTSEEVSKGSSVVVRDAKNIG